MPPYAAFYEELKSFLLETGVAPPTRLGGVLPADIDRLARELGFSLPVGLQHYLLHLGNTSLPGLDLILFSPASILAAAQKAEDYQVTDQLKSVVDSWTGVLVAPPPQAVCYLHYLETTHYFSFIDRHVADGYLLGWDGDEVTHLQRVTLAGYCRQQILFQLKHVCDLRRDYATNTLAAHSIRRYENTRHLDLQEVDWLAPFQHQRISTETLLPILHALEAHISTIEQQEGRLLGLHEYGRLVVQALAHA